MAGFIHSGVVTAMIGFAMLFGVFAIIERLSPEARAQRRWRAGSLVDTVWFFAGYVSRTFAGIAAVICVVVIGRLVPHPVFPGVAAQPAWVQIAEVLLIVDMIGYWTHRAFHRRRLWRIHAVHHSIEEVDWLSSARVHPLDTVVHRPLEAVPLFLLGFSALPVVPTYLFILAVYPIFLHANVRWDYGPLRGVIASPAFHRWHHTAEAKGVDRNFAGLFPFIDILFGTYHLPRRASTAYGLGEGRSIPLRLGAQLAHPFRTS
jgi:sterol desaturase/sphingolipid hydroxylase (fatty acid hydroxylase superfamily)